MSIRFYRREPTAAPSRLPADISLRVWRPAESGFPPRGSRSLRNIVWHGFARLGLFANPDFAELTLWRGGARIGRLILTPRWRRFPFMAADDLQLGDVWIAPAARGQGLARLLIAEAARHAAGRAGQLWYVVDAANAPSVAAAEASGFARAGTGRRTAPLGLRMLGRYVLD